MLSTKFFLIGEKIAKENELEVVRLKICQIQFNALALSYFCLRSRPVSPNVVCPLVRSNVENSD